MRLKKEELNAFAETKSEPVSCRVYGEADGLPATECTAGSQPGALRSRDGTLWFPTTRGLALLNPARLSLNTNPPPVVIEAVQVGGRLQNPETLRSAPPRAVTIPPGKEGLAIEYASLNLAAPDKGRFRYHLEGYQKLNGNIIWTSGKDVFYTFIIYAVIGIFHFIFRKKFFSLSAEGGGSYLWEFLFFLSFAIVLVKSVRIRYSSSLCVSHCSGADWKIIYQ